ncbi:hypothetical protein HDU67_006573 [Dinochytrium kinnereticum]|nr:hypothetical protein HDU67_006573 [Dinochytrium kinnereticum]
MLALLTLTFVLAQGVIVSAASQQQVPMGIADDALVLSAGVPGLTTATGVSASLVAADLPGVRSIEFDEKGDLLALVRGLSGVYALWQEDGMWHRQMIVDGKGLDFTHSMIVHGGYVYASSHSTVYRWPYVSGSRKAVDPQSAEVMVNDINGEFGGVYGHASRTLLIGNGYLYVSLGSRSNIDKDSRAAVIRRFRLDSIPEGGSLFADGQIWAEGTRNNVAMAFDDHGRLWGAENGADDLSRDDLHRIPDLHRASSNYHNDSPVEEVNIFDEPGAFYGYPYCFTAGNVTSTFELDPVRGSQWAWPTFMEDGKHSDRWCRSYRNNQPPALHIPAHSAPIAMTFYSKKRDCGEVGGVPCDYRGNLFVTLHGSWNRDIPSGFSVIMFESKAAGNPIQKIRTLAHATDFQNKCRGRDSFKCFRPAGISISPRGTLFVSSDASGEIVELTFDEK